MRISDWSSDVCSSDLRTAGVRMDKPAWDVSAESCQSIGVHAHFAREDIGRDQQIEQADAFRLAHGSSAIQDTVRFPIPSLLIYTTNGPPQHGLGLPARSVKSRRQVFHARTLPQDCR